jgi:hypothetical protein
MPRKARAPHEAKQSLDGAGQYDLEAEKRRREKIVKDATKALERKDSQSIVRGLRSIRGTLVVHHKLYNLARPDLTLMPVTEVIHLIGHSDSDVTLEAIETAMDLCGRVDGHEHALAEQLYEVLAETDNRIVAAAIRALPACGSHAASVAFDAVVNAAGSSDPQVQAELCRTLPLFDDQLPRRLRDICIAVAALEDETAQLLLLGAILETLRPHDVNPLQIATTLCPPMEKKRALKLLRRLGELGYPVRRALEDADLSPSSNAPLSLLRKPCRVVFPDNSLVEVDERTWHLLKLLIDRYPEPINATKHEFRWRDLDKIRKAYPVIAGWIERSPGAGTRLLSKPKSADSNR